MTEEWRPVVGFEGLYEVSDQGRVRSLDRIISFPTRWGGAAQRPLRGRVLRATSGGDWYPCVNLWSDGRVTNRKVHLIVADAFLGSAPAGTQVCHRDGNKNNCTASNLRRGTPTSNNADKIQHGTHLQGGDCPWAKLTEETVRSIRRSRGRFSQCQLAGVYGVSRSHISMVQNGKSWRHV